jgi:hypothetical protein
MLSLSALLPTNIDVFESRGESDDRNVLNPMTLQRELPQVTVLSAFVSALPLAGTVVFALTAEAISLEVALSFLVLGLTVSLHCLHAVHGRSYSAADASAFVFNLLFLLVAPIAQVLVTGYKLVNTTHARPDLLIETNLVCSLFIAIYLVGRITIFKPPVVQELASTPPMGTDISTFGLAALVGMCGFIVLVSVPFIGASSSDAGLTPVLLAFRKFLFFIPTALFLILLAAVRRRSTQHNFLHLLLMVLLFLFVIATQNPATEKRNGLGPVYLAVMFLIFRSGMMRKGVQVAWLSGILLIFFPITALLTTIPWRYLDQVNIEWATVLSDHFITTHYDAWANVYSVIEMTARNGLSGGKQLLGALLFYVPSNWWSGKPLATGIEIGNYLMTNYTMWFNNLSAPIIAEGFLDFGYLGVVAYGLGLAAFVRRIEIWAGPEQDAMTKAIAAYLAFFLVFLLRGSLMIAFAYGSGAMAAFVVSRMLIALLQTRSAPKLSTNVQAEPIR